MALLTVGFLDGTLGLIYTYHVARAATGGTSYFAYFWLSILVAFVPALYVSLQANQPKVVRQVVLVGWGAFTLLPKFLISVNAPVYFDEYGHFRQVKEIVATGHLQPPNSYVPIISSFPGLETLTAGLHLATGLSIWHSGQVVVLLAHAGCLLVVYEVAAAVGVPDWAAGLAAMFFSLNPSYMFFDTQFSYESLGISLCFLVTLCCLRARLAWTAGQARRWSAAGVLAAAACVTTHHVSSIVALILTALVATLVPPKALDAVTAKAARAGSWVVFGAVTVMTMAWFAGPASATFAYLYPHIQTGLSQLRAMFQKPKGATGPAQAVVAAAAPATHSLFSGSQIPRYEQLAGYLSPFLALVAVATASLVTVFRRERLISLRLGAAFAIVAALYFLSLPLTLTSGGGEAAHRSWAFTYLGVAVVISIGAWHLGRFSAGRRTAIKVALSCIMVVVLVGNVASGEDVDYRFPGPNQFGTDTRSGSPALTTAIEWMQSHIPAGTRVVTDRFTGEYIEGDTDLVVPSPTQYTGYLLYQEGSDPDPQLRAFLRKDNFRYFVLDRTIETEVPLDGFFEGYEDYVSDINPLALYRMGHNSFAVLVYSSGPYEIFELHP
jgi:hypothetical protein